MKKQLSPEIEISLDDVATIMGDSYDFFPEILENCFCSNCDDHITTIVMYTIYLDSLGDIVLRGQCARCGQRVGRHIETGESGASLAAAKQVRKKKAGKYS